MVGRPTKTEAKTTSRECAGEQAVALDRGGTYGFSRFNVSPAAAAGERCR